MKKRTLQEEINRIQEITYGKKLINEDDFGSNWLGDVLGVLGNADGNQQKKIDDPIKADYVSNNVDDFFKTLENINMPFYQQSHGSMTEQKEVESFQIGLLLLGYSLPRHGVDGLFGPETAAAVAKFRKDNNIQALNEVAVPGVDEMAWNKMPFGINDGEVHQGMKWKNHDTHIHFGFTTPQMALDVIHKAQSLGLRASENPYTTGVDKSVHVGNSFHYQTFSGLYDGKQLGKGLDVSGDSAKMAELFKWVSDKGNVGIDYSTPHFEHDDNGVKEVITPEMANVMVTKLKEKGVKSEDLNKFIDPITSGGGASFTDIDVLDDMGYQKYAKICQTFIDKRNPSAQIKGDMLARAAKNSVISYHKYVPPELALAQLALEGGLSSDPTARPIKTNNPFNVGNTETGSKYYSTIQDGVNSYYRLLAHNYLGSGKTANDLIRSFVNKDNNNYSGKDDGKYEAQLSQIAREANKIAQQTTA